MRTFEIGYLLDRFKVGRDCDGPSALSSAEGLPTTQLDLPGFQLLRIRTHVQRSHICRTTHRSNEGQVTLGIFANDSCVSRKTLRTNLQFSNLH